MQNGKSNLIEKIQHISIWYSNSVPYGEAAGENMLP